MTERIHISPFSPAAWSRHLFLF